MGQEVSKKTILWRLLAGLIGCVLLASGDWVMIYGDTAFEGNLAWLTVGAAGIPDWRNGLTMVLAFIAILFYAAGLLGLQDFFPKDKDKRLYTGLTTVGMTPWLCLHLFYTMVLYLFGWMTANGEKELAFAASEALVNHLGWTIFAGEALMLLPFLYLVVQICRRQTAFPRWMAINNPLVIYIVLKLVTTVLPDVPFRLAFVNGLMSESMLIWFAVIYGWAYIHAKR